jgi:hypothetical protein
MCDFHLTYSHDSVAVIDDQGHGLDAIGVVPAMVRESFHTSSAGAARDQRTLTRGEIVIVAGP